MLSVVSGLYIVIVLILCPEIGIAVSDGDSPPPPFPKKKQSNFVIIYKTCNEFRQRDESSTKDVST
jgi:hypothetical protein